MLAATFDFEYLGMEHYKFEQVSWGSFQNSKHKQFHNKLIEMVKSVFEETAERGPGVMSIPFHWTTLRDEELKSVMGTLGITIQSINEYYAQLEINDDCGELSKYSFSNLTSDMQS
jgi:hypothetical protein